MPYHIEYKFEDKNETKQIDRFILEVKNISKDYELSLKTGVKDTDIQVDPDDIYMLLRDYIPSLKTIIAIVLIYISWNQQLLKAGVSQAFLALIL